jgi:nucleoid-associated protein YgaU
VFEASQLTVRAARRRKVMAQTYVTQSGDTLWAIAERFYGDGSQWPRIFHANRDQIGEDQVLYAGKTLNIPDAEEAPPAQTYLTQSGDTLWAIAERFYGDGNQWQRIYDANRDQIGEDQVLYAGKTLKIPA